MKLAIIGHGFVGKAVDYGFSNQLVKKKIIDPVSSVRKIAKIGANINID